MASELSLALAAAVKANHDELGLTELCKDVQGIVSGMAEMTPMETVAALTKSPEDMDRIIPNHPYPAENNWTPLAEAALGQIFDLYCSPETHTMGREAWDEMDRNTMDYSPVILYNIYNHFERSSYEWQRMLFGEFEAELPKRSFLQAMRDLAPGVWSTLRLRTYIRDICEAHTCYWLDSTILEDV